MIALLHAYSDANLGDRLLVDLALERLARLGVPSTDVTIVSLDASSFLDLEVETHAFGTPRRKFSPDVARAAAKSVQAVFDGMTGSESSSLAKVLSGANGLVGVGGGYLRAGTVVERIGVSVNHLPQLTFASHAAAPSCYLPQSIGPLSGVVGRRIRAELSGVDRVFLRDDTSMRELGLANSRRFPDMAVLDLVEHEIPSHSHSDTVLFVARRLGGDRPGYLPRLSALAATVERPIAWAVQARGADEKSDRAFYDELAVEAAGDTSQALRRLRPAVVVSVRLHGSLMSLAQGAPTIHLSYQRKGWAAMQDLGLGEWVHDAGSFDPDRVARQIDEIAADPSRYWECFETRQPVLRDESEQLDHELAATLGLARGRA